MSANLESIRLIHEDIEVLKHLATAALQSRSDPHHPHSRLDEADINISTSGTAEKLVADLVLETQNKSAALLNIYSSQPDFSSKDDSLLLFYSRLRDLREAYRIQTPNTDNVMNQTERDIALIAAAHKPTEFSGEEGGGRFLDLTSHYSSFINLTRPKPCPPYYEYVRETITNFDSVKESIRNKRSFEDYLNSVQQYLEGFAQRAHPLDNASSLIAEARDRERKKIESELAEVTKLSDARHLLEKWQADGVKQRLRNAGLKCGGKPEDRADRLWNAAHKMQYSNRVILERVLSFMLDELLAEERAATVANIEKKLSLSYEEMEAERIADEALQSGGMETKDDDDAEGLEKTIYNPKDVPLGWDGRPIPYWMYKLHGLNHIFKCEICGNATYKGPRAFEKHFSESMHVQGLRKLGISYSKSFMMITEIKDALALQEKIGKTRKEVVFNEENDVEFEDNEGNVMNKKTYEDLKRQGLL